MKATTWPVRLRQSTLSLMLVLMASAICRAQQPASGGMPPAPPEVKKTVDAISGDWSGNMTASIPGLKPETFPWEIKCKSAALGSGAACTLEGKASIGPIAESCLLGYDPSRKEVHYMCITSMGEIHDHQGRWANDTTIEFTPYKAFMLGQPIVETVRLSFPDSHTFHTESVVTTEDGRTMSFTFTGVRK